jgi:hypothetical protein
MLVCFCVQALIAKIREITVMVGRQRVPLPDSGPLSQSPTWNRHPQTGFNDSPHARSAPCDELAGIPDVASIN